MKNFTLNLRLAGGMLLALLLGVQSVAAAPAIEELYGRYRFSGEYSAVDMMTDEPIEVAVPNTTDYEMVVLPDTAANTVRILGFYGFGNGIAATYDEASGTLTCNQEAAFLSANMYMDMTTGMAYGAQVALDGAATGGLGYTFTVKEQDGAIQIVASDPMEAMYVSYETGVMATLVYNAGYILTKEDVSVTAADAAGDYSFTSDDVIYTTLADASEEFDLSVADAGDGKVTLDGLFGIEGAVVCDYYEDGGIIVLPDTFRYDNGLYWGQMTMEVMAPEYGPYFYVVDGRLTTPANFYLYGAFDEMLGGAATFSFIGGEAVKDGSGIAGTVAEEGEGIRVADGAICVEDGAAVAVYDLQGMKVAEGVSRIDGLKTGLYIVKAGDHTAKVVLK